MEILHYPLSYKRLKTRVVTIGDLNIGGDNPICVQSMLTSDTQNLDGCLKEIKSLLAVGCRLIRLTVPARKDLEAVYQLKEKMRDEGIDAPLVADIHYSPALAVDACELFEKIRINPGNYSDRPKSSKTTNSNLAFQEGRDRLQEKIQPLVQNLKKYRRALRIGVNQGSLSTRMIERYGDSPLGMVKSALEMVQLFEEEEFDQIVISLKSSNPVIVQKAYRLLIEMQTGDCFVPLHLGVTEAGEGVMGRIKSLAGIGPLLVDGIGDTIRVSLTEPSANEIQFAQAFLSAIEPERADESPEQFYWERPLNQMRPKNRPQTVENHQVGEASPLKIGTLEGAKPPRLSVPFTADFTYRKLNNGFYWDDQSRPMQVIRNLNRLPSQKDAGKHCAYLFVSIRPLFLLRQFYQLYQDKLDLPAGFLLPKMLGFSAQTQVASMLSEGLLDFILIPDQMSAQDLHSFLYLLQATRSKILMTDYIVCPSCGRTQFDIQKTTAQIKKRTSHLKGLKIGVMGCIVNGPGEMADADFGYVGSGDGKIDLYFGQQRICRGIPQHQAVDRLIDLIKEKGYWRD